MRAADRKIAVMCDLVADLKTNFEVMVSVNNISRYLQQCNVT